MQWPNPPSQENSSRTANGHQLLLGPGGFISSKEKRYRSSQKAKKATHAITTKLVSHFSFPFWKRIQRRSHNGLPSGPVIVVLKIDTTYQVQWNEEWTIRQDADKIEGTIWNFLIFSSTKNYDELFFVSFHNED